MVRVISSALNKNNSRVTLEYIGVDVKGMAYKIAPLHGCSVSDNIKVTLLPVSGKLGKEFGTISFNKGNHGVALATFLESVRNL
jgi:hypothetical protein